MRRDLWEDLVSFSNNNQGPWRVVGDFNVISKVMEKQGGTPYRLEKSFEFLNFMEDASVKEAFLMGTYLRDIITGILRALSGEGWTKWFSHFYKTIVSHLARTYSDHVP